MNGKLSNLNLLLAFLVLVLLPQPAFSQESTTSLSVRFVADSRFGKTMGEFKETKVISIDRKSKQGRFQVNVSSLATGNGLRDSHLREEDFFYVEKFPVSELEISDLKTSEGKFTAKGQLNLRGISQEIPFRGTWETADGQEIYSGSFVISRKYFRILYDSAINPIGDEVLVVFEVKLPLEASKK